MELKVYKDVKKDYPTVYNKVKKAYSFAYKTKLARFDDVVKTVFTIDNIPCKVVIEIEDYEPIYIEKYLELIKDYLKFVKKNQDDKKCWD